VLIEFCTFDTFYFAVENLLKPVGLSIASQGVSPLYLGMSQQADNIYLYMFMLV